MPSSKVHNLRLLGGTLVLEPLSKNELADTVKRVFPNDNLDKRCEK